MTSTLLQPRCQGIDGVSLSTLRDHSVVRDVGYEWESQYVGYNYGTHTYAIEAAWDAGLPVMPNVEAEPDAAKGGYARGVQMAKKAIVDLERLGFEGECPVPFSAADKMFTDLFGAGLQYHKALVDVFGDRGWVGGAYGFKVLMERLPLQEWWPEDWPIWHWGGDGFTIYNWAWAKQWYGRTPTWVYDPPRPPHDNTGFGLDENTLLKPMKFWSGYGHDAPLPPQQEDDMTPEEHQMLVDALAAAKDTFRLLWDADPSSNISTYFAVQELHGNIVRTDAFIDRVVAALPAGSGLTVQQVVDACKTAARQGTG